MHCSKAKLESLKTSSHLKTCMAQFTCFGEFIIQSHRRSPSCTQHVSTYQHQPSPPKKTPHKTPKTIKNANKWWYASWVSIRCRGLHVYESGKVRSLQHTACGQRQAAWCMTQAHPRAGLWRFAEETRRGTSIQVQWSTWMAIGLGGLREWRMGFWLIGSVFFFEAWCELLFP